MKFSVNFSPTHITPAQIFGKEENVYEIFRENFERQNSSRFSSPFSSFGGVGGLWDLGRDAGGGSKGSSHTPGGGGREGRRKFLGWG